MKRIIGNEVDFPVHSFVAVHFFDFLGDMYYEESIEKKLITPSCYHNHLRLYVCRAW